MIVLLTASRTWDDAAYIEWVLDGLLAECKGQPLVLHHGDCGKGGDQISDLWARRQQQVGANVKVVRHPAQWRDLGGVFDRRAGFRRNAEMVAAVVTAIGEKVCVAFIRDRSGGATHCANTASRAGIPTVRHRWEEREAVA